MRALIVLAVVWTGQLAAADEMIFLIVDGVGSPMWNTRHLELFDHYQLTDELKSKGTLRRWSEDPFSSYRDLDDQKGYVFTLGPAGKTVRTGFVTLKGSPDTFELFVSDKIAELKARMPSDLDVTVTRSGDRVTIENPAFTWKDNPRFSSAAWELHLRYSDPVMINAGGPESLARIERVPLKSISPMLKAARGKLSYYVFQPDQVPDRIRLAALELSLIHI